jgi:phosphoglycerate dehydrogenase-like enzyme
MKVLLTWPANDDELKILHRHVPGAAKLVATPALPDLGHLESDPADIVELGSDADAVIGCMDVSHEMLKGLGSLKFIAWLHTGCDSLDLAALKSQGIQVSNIRGAMAVAVAEHAFALMLALAKRLLESHRAVVDGEFHTMYDPAFSSVELARKTICIIGLGNIGQQLAKRAKAFDMQVLGVDPTLRGEFADKVFPPKDLQKVISQADFIVLTVPLTNETKGIIGERELRAMRSTAYLINVSRGSLVKEGPLARALAEGAIAGFGSDCWWDYPDRVPPSYHYQLPSRLGVHRMAHVVGTGGLAASVVEVWLRTVEMGAESMGAFLRGEPPPRLINLDLGY